MPPFLAGAGSWMGDDASSPAVVFPEHINMDAAITTERIVCFMESLLVEIGVLRAVANARYTGRGPKM
jgi:hypothetical protein